MPSYNQIGFDSLHYLVTMVEPGVAWMAGAKLDADGKTIPDPESKSLFPLAVARDGALLTMASDEELLVEVMSFRLPFRSFRLAMRQGTSGQSVAATSGSTVCGEVPFLAHSSRRSVCATRRRT
jgi:hypothetical protein